MERIAVLGAGAIGSGEATLITGHGLPCTVVGRSEAGLRRCEEAVRQNWNDLIAEGLATEENRAAALALLTVTNNPGALEGCTFILEAVSEDAEQKRTAFRAAERYAAPGAVIASCTSSFDVEFLAGLTNRPENLLAAHPFQPAHMLPLVEVVPHPGTSDSALRRTLALLETLHRQVVVLKRSVPGFLVNRLAQALFREAIHLVELGVTDAVGIDRAVKYAVGMRYASIGLLEYFDAVGFELESVIARNVYPSLCAAQEIQSLVREGLDSGRTGQAAGSGLYVWADRDPADFRRRKQSPYFEGVREWTMPGGGRPGGASPSP